MLSRCSTSAAEYNVTTEETGSSTCSLSMLLYLWIGLWNTNSPSSITLIIVGYTSRSDYSVVAFISNRASNCMVVRVAINAVCLSEVHHHLASISSH